MINKLEQDVFYVSRTLQNGFQCDICFLDKLCQTIACKTSCKYLFEEVRQALRSQSVHGKHFKRFWWMLQENYYRTVCLADYRICSQDFDTFYSQKYLERIRCLWLESHRKLLLCWENAISKYVFKLLTCCISKFFFK